MEAADVKTDTERKNVDAGVEWRKALLPEDATLQQAIHNLNDSALQMAMVVSRKGLLLGTNI